MTIADIKVISEGGVEAVNDSGIVMRPTEDGGSLIPDQAVHGEAVGDDGTQHDDTSHRDGVEDVELGQDGDVGGLLGGVHGGGHDGSHSREARVELGHGEHLDSEDEVGGEEGEDDDDPCPDWEEGGHQAQGHSSV